MSVSVEVAGVYRSYSSLSSYLNCQKAWELSRLLGVKEQPAWWFAGGKAVHTATEVFDNRLFMAEGR